MLKKRIGIKGGIVLLIFILAGILFCILQYYSALKDERTEWHNSNYIEMGFKGTILNVGDYGYNNDFNKRYLNLTISIADSLNPEIHYGMLDYIKQPLLKTFISQGDSVIKLPNETYITFKKQNGLTKTFELPIDIK